MPGDARLVRSFTVQAASARAGAPAAADCPRYAAAKGGKRGLILPADGLNAGAGTSWRDPVIVTQGTSDSRPRDLPALPSSSLTTMTPRAKASRPLPPRSSASAHPRRFVLQPDGRKDVRTWGLDGGSGNASDARLIQTDLRAPTSGEARPAVSLRVRPLSDRGVAQGRGSSPPLYDRLAT
jgi:hypothetical protein